MAKPKATLPDGREVNSCLMPAPIPADEAKLYRRLRQAHCARGHQAGQECSGRLTIDRNGITLQCPLCGDARRVYGQ